uniref:Uncharacterized protein n=1 Tax=Sipha flava TaxID=143950 RepID=A0A2S2PW46_9HEMI
MDLVEPKFCRRDYTLQTDRRNISDIGVRIDNEVAVVPSSTDVIGKYATGKALTTRSKTLSNSSIKQVAQTTEMPLIMTKQKVPYVIESIDEVIVSLMALPITYTEEREDDYKEKLLIARLELHEVNLRSRFLEVKTRLSSYENMTWFASGLVSTL